MERRNKAAPLLLWLILLHFVTASLADEGLNPFNSLLPPTPPYDPSARLVLPDIPAEGVALEMPDPLRIYYREVGAALRPSSLELWIDGVEHTEQLEFWGDHATFALPSPSMYGQGTHTVITRILDENGTTFELIDDIVIAGEPCPGGCPWPFDDTSEPSVVSNLMEDWNDFTGPGYWHSGLDIRADAGTPVKACAPGTVIKVLNYRPGHVSNQLYWEVAIEDAEGFIWQYHHLEQGSITVSEGQNVLQGQVLGEVVPWPEGYHDQLYHHLHLNVVRWVGMGSVDGPYEEGFLYYNPLNFLVKGSYVDTIDPERMDVYYADNEANNFFDSDLNSGTPQLSGDVDIHARLEDTMTTIPPAAGQPYELGIYKLAMEAIPVITPCDAGYLPKQQLGRFDMVPGGAIIANQDELLHAIYQEHVSPVHETEFTINVRRFHYTLTNVHAGFPDDPNGFWDTDRNSPIAGPRYPDGYYQLNIYATDWHGNESLFMLPVELSNGLGFAGQCPLDITDMAWEDPVEIHSAGGQRWLTNPQALPLSFSAMERGKATATPSGAQWQPWEFELPSRGVAVKIAAMTGPGKAITVEYIPYLGDVILEIKAVAQVWGLTSGQLLSSTPVPLRLSTRLARDPWTGQAHVGTPDPSGSGKPRLVMAALIDVLGEPMLLRTQAGGSAISWLAATAVHEEPAPTLPTGAELTAHPNPFNPTVSVSLTLERETKVLVMVYDAAGRRVRRLHSGDTHAGITQFLWDGTDAAGGPQPSGIYFIRATGNGVYESIKVALLK